MQQNPKILPMFLALVASETKFCTVYPAFGLISQWSPVQPLVQSQNLSSKENGTLSKTLHPQTVKEHENTHPGVGSSSALHFPPFVQKALEVPCLL